MHPVAPTLHALTTPNNYYRPGRNISQHALHRFGRPALFILLLCIYIYILRPALKPLTLRAHIIAMGAMELSKSESWHFAFQHLCTSRFGVLEGPLKFIPRRRPCQSISTRSNQEAFGQAWSGVRVPFHTFSVSLFSIFSTRCSHAPYDSHPVCHKSTLTCKMTPSR